MKKLFIITIFSMLFFINANSQEITNKTQKNAIGVSGGAGYGFDYSRTLKKDKLYATISYGSFVFALNDIEQEISGETLLIDTEINFKNIDAKISFHPFGNAFKILAGVGFFISSNVNVKTSFKESLFVGDVEFKSEDTGNLEVNFKWGEITPYFGIGFGRSVPKGRIGFAIDMGTYYSSSPEITLDATGIIEQTKDQEALLNNTFNTFKFIPYAAFRLSFSL